MPTPDSRHRIAAAFAFLAAALPTAQAPAQTPPGVALEVVSAELDFPVYATHAGDERLFIVEKDGRVLIFEGGELAATPFLDVRDRVRSTGSEQGLTSVAFAPDYRSSGFFFAHYVRGDGDTVLSRFRVSADPDRANPASEVVLLVIDQPFSNHNGGQLQFGPDGHLYLGTGDGGSGNDPLCRAQAGDSLLGKLLRLDVASNRNTPPFYAIPPDNPHVGAGPPLDEIWASGLRNPWRFSFDRTTGDLYLGDVGQNDREEVDFLPAGTGAGTNFGWKMLEGNLCLGDSGGCTTPPPPCGSPAYTAPVLDFPHGAPDFHCSVTGGYVYRGQAIQGLRGFYLYGDFCSGTLWAARRQGGRWVTRELSATLPGITSFGEDENGEIVLLGNGALHRLVGTDPGGRPGTLALALATVAVAELATSATLEVRRTGGDDGAVSVAFRTQAETATAGADFTGRQGVLSWADGDDDPKSIVIPLLPDTGVEGDETFRVTLESPGGGALLGQATAAVTIVDDDQLPPPCAVDGGTLCLRDGRFSVETRWRTRSGTEGEGTAVPLTGDTGYFWFFDAANVEVVVKVLDACGLEPFESFWVFASGLTNVEVSLTVQDTVTGFSNVYTNALGTPFAPIQDTDAFDTCP